MIKVIVMTMWLLDFLPVRIMRQERAVVPAPETSPWDRLTNHSRNPEYDSSC